MERQTEENKIRVQVKVRLVAEEPCWGPGTRMIMQGIKETGSVRDSSREAGISYSKARKIISRAEKGLGTSIVERRQGGEHGGVSRLTGEGEKRAALYEELEREVQKFAEAKYRELWTRFFSDSE